MHEPGLRGPQGERGERGERGPEGRTVEKRWYRLSDRRLLVIFLFIVVVGGYLVHAKDVDNWQQCQRSHINTAKINRTFKAQQDFLSKFVAKAPDPTQLRAYIKIFADAKLTVPDCGSEPWI